MVASFEQQTLASTARVEQEEIDPAALEINTALKKTPSSESSPYAGAICRGRRERFLSTASRAKIGPNHCDLHA